MASTYTDLLRLEKQADGENENTWGQILNAQFELIEDAISGRVSLVLASSNVTLSSNNGALDQARMAILDLSGTLTANIEIIVPAKSKFYIVKNGTSLTGSETITVKTSGGTGIEITAAASELVFCDGTDVYRVSAPTEVAADSLQLGGVDAASYARLDVSQNFTKAQRVTPVAGSGTSITPNFSNGNILKHTLTGNTTINNPTLTGLDGQVVIIKLKQAAASVYSVTWGSAFEWIGSAPTMTTAFGGVDILTGYIDETDAKIYMTALQGY